MPRLVRWSIDKVITAAGLLIGAAGLVASQEVGAAILAVIGLAIVAGVAATAAPQDRWLLALASVAFGARVAAIGSLSAVAFASDRVPYLFGDEAGYHEFAMASVSALRAGVSPVQVLAGHGAVGANPYIDAQALLILVFGDQAGLIKIVNAVVGVVCAVLGYDLARRFFGVAAGRAAAIGLAFFPSLFLWSIVNLRDIWIVALLLILVWTFEMLRARAQWHVLAAGLLALAWIQGIRNGLYLAVATPYVASVGFALRCAGWRTRLAMTAVAFLVGYAFLVQLSGYGPLGIGLLRPSTLQYIENQHAFFAFGARTAFRPTATTSPHVVVLPVGEVFRIETAGAAAVTTPTPLPGQIEPKPAPATPIVVLPGQKVVLVAPGATPDPDPGFVYVRPGDLVVVQGPRRSIDPRPYVMQFGQENYIEVRAEDEMQDAPTRLLRIAGTLPRGLLFLIVAPFPGLTSTGLEAPALGEMLPWLTVLAAALATTWRGLGDIARLGPMLLLTLLLVVMLSIVEGNVGTLIRHRSMLIGYVVVLASPTLVGWAVSIRNTWLSRRF